jgi:hypothetical protein
MSRWKNSRPSKKSSGTTNNFEIRRPRNVCFPPHDSEATEGLLLLPGLGITGDPPSQE